MHLRRIEKWAIAVTVLFLAVLVGYGFGVSARDGGVFSVRTEKQVPAAAILLGGDTAAATAAPAPSAPAGEAAGKRVDINRADEWELCTLPGIGEALAGRIVAYREEHGGFKTPEDLMAVQGIGEKTYARLRDFITVTEG